MLIECPRHPGKLLPDTDCPKIVLSLPTAADLALCLECEHGQKLAASCPYQTRRQTVATPVESVAPVEPAAQEAAPATCKEKGPKLKKPAALVKPAKKAPVKREPARQAPTPVPGATREENRERLRQLLAFLYASKYKTITVGIAGQYAARFDFEGDMTEALAEAGITVRKIGGAMKIMRNQALRNFVKGI